MPSGEICRLCGERKKMLHNLFNGNFLQKIHDTVHLTITMDDALPKSACYDCQRQIDLFYSFKLRCQRAEGRLYEIAANGQLNVKTVNCIKQEVADVEPQIATLHPSTEHNYFAVTAASHKIKIKTEVTEVVVAADPVDEEADVEDSNVEFEKLVYQHALVDVKEPIVDVIQVFDSDPVGEEVTSKDEHVHPSNEILGQACYEEKPSLSESHTNYGGFNDEDLVLKENEPELSDYERVEAEIMKKRNPSMRFKCPLCCRSFKFYKGYLKHKVTTHRDGDPHVYSCSDCSVDFKSLVLLKRHVFRMHIEEPRYCCKHCLMQFRAKREYRSHLRSHQKMIYQCERCKKEFPSKKKLSAHMQRHINPEFHDCVKCDKSFKSISSLQYHQERHKGTKILHCAECSSEFTSKNGLVRHLKAHQSLAYPCSSCNKSFTQAPSLKRHQMNVHEAAGGLVRPPQILSCTVCDKSFWNHSNLANHKKTHVKKHLCTYCGMKWARIQQLKEHVLTVHKMLRHRCPMRGCEASYTQRTPLATHFRQRHPGFSLMSRSRSSLSSQSETLSGSQITYHYSSDAVS